MRNAVWAIAVVCGVAHTAGAQQISWEPFAFDAPQGGRVTAERGWLDVPARHERADSARIRLPLVRLKSTNPAPGPPIVFWLAGRATPALGSSPVVCIRTRRGWPNTPTSSRSISVGLGCLSPVSSSPAASICRPIALLIPPRRARG
jgi:hypothetical protein